MGSDACKVRSAKCALARRHKSLESKHVARYLPKVVTVAVLEGDDLLLPEWVCNGRDTHMSRAPHND